MPTRTVASLRQRELFAKLAGVPVVVGAKSATDQWSVNLHGTVVLYDKDWSAKTDKDPQETLLAIRDDDGVPLTSSGEPRFHLHVDWREVRWARLEEQELRLIGLNRAVAFYASKDGGRIFALYCVDRDVRSIMAIGEWIDLSPTPPQGARVV
jgi:hypothetical protein